jgi:hypothetical protein
MTPLSWSTFFYLIIEDHLVVFSLPMGTIMQFHLFIFLEKYLLCGSSVNVVESISML